MKTILLGLALLLFCSCENNLILADSPVSNPLVVRSTELVGKNSCKYYANTGGGYFMWQNRIEFITGRGLFNVGDTIKITLNK